MSKPRYKWWGYMKAVIRDYPALCREYDALHAPNVTSRMSGMPTGGNVSRSTEDIAVRELPYTRQREYEAVRRAVERTRRRRTADERMALVDMVFWKRSHTLDGAAYKIGISYSTAQRYHRDFVCEVARCYGLLDTQS